MTRKQEIYRDMLSWALPQTRNSLKYVTSLEPFTVLGRKRLRSLRGHYAVAQLVHGLAYILLEEEFTDADISFLNFGARSFCENSAETCTHYPLFAYFIQELFKVVPEDKRQQLEWDGPQGDYSWARPRRGNEPGVLS